MKIRMCYNKFNNKEMFEQHALYNVKYIVFVVAFVV